MSKNEQSQSMFEIHFMIGIFNFIKYSIQFFKNLQLGNHLFTLKHTTCLYYFPSCITFKKMTMDCTVQVGCLAWLRWLQLDSVKLLVYYSSDSVCYNRLAEKAERTKQCKWNFKKQTFHIRFASVAYSMTRYLNLKLPKSWNVPSEAVVVPWLYHSETVFTFHTLCLKQEYLLI